VVLFSLTDDCEYHKIINREEIGISVGQRNSKLLADFILELKTNPGKMKRITSNARAYAARRLSRKVNTIKFIQLFNQLALR